MRKFIILLLALGVISCTANKNDVNVVDRNISEIESSTTKKDEISPVKTKFVWRNSLGEEFPVYINSHGSCFRVEFYSKPNNNTPVALFAQTYRE